VTRARGGPATPAEGTGVADDQFIEGLTGRTYHVAALSRGLAVLTELAALGAPATLATLSERTNVPKSTLVRLLSVMTSLNYVTRTDTRPAFWLGPAVMPLGRAYAASLDITAVAKPVLAGVAAESGQTANLGILDGAQIVHLCVVEPDRPIRFLAAPGSRDGTYHTGLGKLLLAYLGPAEVLLHLPAEPFPARTSHTIRHLADLAPRLAEIRQAGYAFDDQEGDLGVRCLAVPVRVDGLVVAALSISGPAGELEPSAHPGFVRLLNAAAASLAESEQFRFLLGEALRALP
jgi:IclR family transcriptional regulator, acetate operon repressor